MLLPNNFNDAPISKALNVLEVMNFNKQEREAYEDRAKWLSLQASALKKKEQEGIERGKEIGRLEGKLETAKNMLARGDSIKDIAAVTVLDKREIEKL